MVYKWNAGPTCCQSRSWVLLIAGLHHTTLILSSKVLKNTSCQTTTSKSSTKLNTMASQDQFHSMMTLWQGTIPHSLAIPFLDSHQQFRSSSLADVGRNLPLTIEWMSTEVRTFDFLNSLSHTAWSANYWSYKLVSINMQARVMVHVCLFKNFFAVFSSQMLSLYFECYCHPVLLGR